MLVSLIACSKVIFGNLIQIVLELTIIAFFAKFIFRWIKQKTLKLLFFVFI